MNRVQLETLLVREGFREDAYSLDSGLPDEAYRLDHLTGQWSVYYSDRGWHTGLRDFPDEASDCRYSAFIMCSIRWAKDVSSASEPSS